MTTIEFVKRRVSRYYWNEDINCAITTLKILSEAFNIELNKQTFDAAIGMHGAGKFGAQCGLVEGTLMFLGIFGRAINMKEDVIVDTCREFAQEFEIKFKSLECRFLRPEGFHPDNPPHICGQITCEAINFSINFIAKLYDKSVIPTN
jgi:C_GCAxxG_C_C family probable redox protein